MDTRRATLERLRFVMTGGALSPATTRLLTTEVLPLRIERRASCDGVVIDTQRWMTDDALFVEVDREVERTWSTAITVRGGALDLPQVALEVFVRCQRLAPRHNAASSSSIWSAARRVHASLHDTSKPLVKADLDHAVDTWQWLLRLAPRAGLALQLAALFHDIERIESEADRRVEHVAPDYDAFKNAHARRGADLAYDTLRVAGLDEATAERVRELVGAHERRGLDDADVALLNDADGLSFFSLNSPGYADYFGPEQTRRKVEYTLRRLGAVAKRRLLFVRLRADVRAHLAACLSGTPARERQRQ